MNALDIRWPRLLWDQTSREFFDPSTVDADRQLTSIEGAPEDSVVRCFQPTSDVATIMVTNERLFADPFQLHILRDDEGTLIGQLAFLKLHDAFQKRGILTHTRCFGQPGARENDDMRGRAQQLLGVREIAGRSMYGLYSYSAPSPVFSKQTTARQGPNHFT